MKNKKNTPMESGFSFFERDTDIVMKARRDEPARSVGAVIMNGLGGLITIQGTRR